MIDRFSLDLAPLGTKTSGTVSWKNTLKKGDTVDAHDKSIWNKSTILEI